MRKLFLILFLFPIIAKSQIVADTTVYTTNEGETVKVVSYRNTTTSNIPTTTRLRDSIAVVRALIPDVSGKANLASPTFTGTVVLPNSTVTNAMLAGSIDLTTKVTGALPFANGGFTGSAATSATTGAMTVTMNTRLITITPTGACTFNASGGVTGQVITFLVTTSGVSSFVLTFGTNFRSVGTLATGTTSARFFSVSFICVNGTTWQEIGRTAVQT